MAEIFLDGYPEVTSHRGYSAVAPENTLPAFQAAIDSNSQYAELEAETARIILENDFADDCVVTSISYESLEKVKEAAPELKTGYILAIGAGDYYDLPAADFFSVETTFITPGMVDAIHDRGKEVHAWTVDTEEDATKMIDADVDNTIIGNPPMVQEKINDDMTLLFNLLSTDDDFDSLQEYFSEEVFDRLQQRFNSDEAESVFRSQ